MSTKKIHNEIHDVPSFLNRVFALKSEHNFTCFRGEANSSWKMQPTVRRGLRPEAESNVISELTLEADIEFDSDRSMFRKLVRAQHYGLPTRLLDVTLNPLVALFFACSDEAELSSNGRVTVMHIEDGRIKFADSDTVSVICNLANLRDEERKEIREVLDKFREADRISRADRSAFNKLKAVDRLVQFVRIEKPYFRAEIDPVHLQRYYFVHPPKNNKRVVVQSGAFVVAGLMDYKNGVSSERFRLVELVIPSARKKLMLEQLDKININSRTMFPEIEFTSKYIKERWTAKGDGSSQA